MQKVLSFLLLYSLFTSVFLNAMDESIKQKIEALRKECCSLQSEHKKECSECRTYSFINFCSEYVKYHHNLIDAINTLILRHSTIFGSTAQGSILALPKEVFDIILNQIYQDNLSNFKKICETNKDACYWFL